MKRGLILIFILCAMKANAQDYLIYFAGTGASTTIDSVRVENLTKGTKVKLNGGDILRLNVVTGINDIIVDLPDKIGFYPNPMKDYTRMQFVLPETGETLITLHDISGRKIAQTRDLLSKGQQTYRIQDIGEGIYFVRISCGRYSTSGRLLSSCSQSKKAKIVYENSYDPGHKNESHEKESYVKGTNQEILMQYTTGDRLKFRGISGIYRTVVTDIPAESKTISFLFLACTDGDNNNYSIVQIGSQIWMAENLKTTKYRNGDLIGTTTPAASDISGESTPKYQWAYNGNESNVPVYGRLYTWYTVTDTRSVCPEGWHVPNNDDWTALTISLGGEMLAGRKLKETGYAHWVSSYYIATNETGFTGLPGGRRSESYGFGQMGYSGSWWTTTEYNSTYAWYRLMDFNGDLLNNDWLGHTKKEGLSVRCLKD